MAGHYETQGEAAVLVWVTDEPKPKADRKAKADPKAKPDPEA